MKLTYGGIASVIIEVLDCVREPLLNEPSLLTEHWVHEIKSRYSKHKSSMAFSQAAHQARVEVVEMILKELLAEKLRDIGPAR